MIYLFLADGFEEVEALCPLDLLRRAGCAVTMVGVGGTEIRGAHGITVTADIPAELYKDSAPEMVILPGGMPGAKNLAASATVKAAVTAAATHGAFLCAICAAPMILGQMGLLAGKKATCYPGFEEKLTGADKVRDRVVRDGNIITAAGMGVALPFGLSLVEALCGKANADALRAAVLADE